MKAPLRRFAETGSAYAERLRQDYVPLLNALDAPFRRRPDASPAPQAAGVPSANRGLNVLNVQSTDAPGDAALAIVDFLTFSAQLSVLLPGEFGARVRAEAAQGCATSIELLCRYVLQAIAPDSGLVIDGSVRGFRNFYEYHCRIVTPAGKVCGFVALGGERQRGTFCVELTGDGCAHVRAWAHARAVLEGWAAKLTRVDCAHDDRAGRYTLDDVQRWYDDGQFRVQGLQGRKPAIGYAGYKDGSGQTIYVGKNTGNQQLCVYEKGKQLGDPSSPWLRFEARFGSKYRDIPYDILERPWEFITGHYPALSWISELTTRMQTAVAKGAASMAASLRHARRQCGRVVNALAAVFTAPADFAHAVGQLLKREGLPAWVDANPLGARVLEPILEPQLRALIV